MVEYKKKASSKVSAIEKRAQKAATSQALKELESLFSGSKLNKEKLVSLEAIRAARGTSSYYDQLTSYIEKFGVPLEWDVQLMFLDHKDATAVKAVLAELMKTAPIQPLAKQQLLSQKLKVMSLSVFDSELLDQIEL